MTESDAPKCSCNYVIAEAGMQAYHTSMLRFFSIHVHVAIGKDFLHSCRQGVSYNSDFNLCMLCAYNTRACSKLFCLHS